MKAEKLCGFLELGQMDDDSPGVKLRTDNGEEITIPLTKEQVQQVGVEGLLFRNLRLTIILEADGT